MIVTTPNTTRGSAAAQLFLHKLLCNIRASGRIAVLSDQEGDGWMYDYRFVEAVR